MISFPLSLDHSLSLLPLYFPFSFSFHSSHSSHFPSRLLSLSFDLSLPPEFLSSFLSLCLSLTLSLLASLHDGNCFRHEVRGEENPVSSFPLFPLTFFFLLFFSSSTPSFLLLPFFFLSFPSAYFWEVIFPLGAWLACVAQLWHAGERT